MGYLQPLGNLHMASPACFLQCLMSWCSDPRWRLWCFVGILLKITIHRKAVSKPLESGVKTPPFRTIFPSFRLPKVHGIWHALAAHTLVQHGSTPCRKVLPGWFHDVVPSYMFQLSNLFDFLGVAILLEYTSREISGGKRNVHSFFDISTYPVLSCDKRARLLLEFTVALSAKRIEVRSSIPKGCLPNSTSLRQNHTQNRDVFTVFTPQRPYLPQGLGA